MFSFKHLFLLPVLFIVFNVQGKIKLPALISDNMVLQRTSKVPLWGAADPDATIHITTSWNQKQYTTHSDAKGNWRILINTPAAGGPYSITFSDGTPLTIKNILIGEVWICSGQSNMEISMKGYRNQPILHANDILTYADNNKLRLFHVKRAVANEPLKDCTGSWDISSAESASTFSAVGFQFAQKLQHILKVPVGIIEAAWGGTPIVGWMNKESLVPFPDVKIPSENDRLKADRLRPTCLFNGMIAPLVGFGIKGFLWYQGEHDVRHPSGYDKMMEAMVKSWRALWQRDTLPFYYVQIAPWEYRSNADSVPYLRAAQMRAQQEIPHSGMVVSIDVGSSSTVHPPDKTTISKRLLYWALGDAYHKKGIAYKSPVYKQMKIKESNIALTFSHAPRGFTSYGEDIKGFEVAGADHEFYPAKAKIYHKTIVVQSKNVQKPVAVRYAFKDWVKGNLYNTAGLPVAPFRTDKW